MVGCQAMYQNNILVLQNKTLTICADHSHIAVVICTVQGHISHAIIRTVKKTPLTSIAPHIVQPHSAVNSTEPIMTVQHRSDHGRESSCSANNSSIIKRPVVATYCAPFVVEEYFNETTILATNRQVARGIPDTQSCARQLRRSGRRIKAEVDGERYWRELHK